MNTIQLPLQPVENPLVNVFNAVIDGVQQLAVNARDLHSFLKVGKVFGAWINERIEKYGFIENQDYILTISKTGKRSNVIVKDYHLTLDTAKELAMVENNEQGRKVRRYFIQCEKAVYKSDSHQRQALVTACDKLAVGHALRSDVYKMVGNHFGYDDVVSIPTPLLPEAVAFVYELLLAKQKIVEQKAYHDKDVQFIMYYMPELFNLIKHQVCPALRLIQSPLAGRLMGLATETVVHVNVLNRLALNDGMLTLNHVQHNPVKI